jgi:HK97 family phage major capsid protein
MKKLSDQIKDLENTRAAKAGRMSDITQKSMDEGRSMDEAEAEEFDTIDGEIKLLDGDLVRLRRLEHLNVQRAAPVEQSRSQGNASEQRSVSRPAIGAPTIILNREPEERFAGQNFTRMVIARTLAQLDRDNLATEARSAVEIAQHRWGATNPTLVNVIRASVAGHGAGSGEAGAELVQADARFTGDFIAYLYAQTVYDRLGLREVPANVTIKGQDGAATGYWVGESKGIPASKADFSTVSLSPLKVAALAVASMELLRDSTPAAEQLIRDALVAAAAQRIDGTFVSASAASAGVSPAGLLNGVTAFGSFGSDGDALRADIKTLYGPFLSAYNATGLTFVMNPATAKAIQLMTNALGQTEFPSITTTGGTLLGDPVVTGDNVNASHLILCKPSDIWRIGSMGIEVSLSRDATVEMATDPAAASDTPAAQANYPVSMFQTASVALRVIIPMNFAKRRTHAVQYINEANYGNTVSSD